MIQDEILSIVNTSEEALTVNIIKRYLEERAIKIAYGITTFTIGDIRRAVQKLVDEKKIEHVKKETEINLFQKIEGDNGTQRS